MRVREPAFGGDPGSITLWAYWRSSASWRVRIGLQLKGLPYEVEPVHLLREGGQQRQAAHAQRNPLRQVPVLELIHDGRRIQLTQSLAILDYLDRRFPEVPLSPADPLLRARAWQHAEIVNAGIQPVQNLTVLQEVVALGGDKLAWGRRWIARGLHAMEALARDTAGAFLVGDQLTMADLCLVPQMYNARRFGVELSEVPLLTRIEARCSALPAFVAAHPDAQPDAGQTA